jgi:hypothetical protein
VKRTKKVKPTGKPVYALILDFGGGDLPEAYEIHNRKDWRDAHAKIQAHAADFLFAVWPPPSIEVRKLTRYEWNKAVKNGKKQS